MVRRGHVDDVDAIVAQELLERGVCLPDAEAFGPRRAALRCAAEHSPHVDPDPAQRPDVDGTDEAGPDHGRANARECHPRALLQARRDRTSPLGHPGGDRDYLLVDEQPFGAIHFKHPTGPARSGRFRAITPGLARTGSPYPMSHGPDPRDRSRNRRPRRRVPVGRAPVSEYDEQQELEAARERNDLDIGDLRQMSVTELRQVGRDLQVDSAIDRREDLVDRILQRQTERAGHAYATGILDIVDEGFGFMRRHGLLPSPDDVYVSSSQVRRFGLRIGDRISGAVRAPRDAEKYWGMLRVDAVNGVDIETARARPIFNDLTPVHPDELINLETDPKNLSQRLINLVNPLGKGQRALIVSPPKAGKTFLLKHIANGVSANYPDVLLMVALIGERPEEVTDMRRSVKGEVISSTFDEPTENHTHVAEMALEIAKRQVETGRDVVILLDSITRLARAYNLALPPSGRTLSGGIDPIALYPPKRFFGAARNIEEGGSLTIIATCLVDTGSRMDDVIYEEFKGTGNSELILDRKLAEKRIYPSIDVQRSGTRREELLLEEPVLKMVWTMRRMLSAVGTNEGIELLLNRLSKTETNVQFLGSLTKSLEA